MSVWAAEWEFIYVGDRMAETSAPALHSPASGRPH